MSSDCDCPVEGSVDAQGAGNGETFLALKDQYVKLKTMLEEKDVRFFSCGIHFE